MRFFMLTASFLLFCTPVAFSVTDHEPNKEQQREPMEWAYDNAASRVESSLRIRRIQSMINSQVELADDAVFEAMTLETDR